VLAGGAWLGAGELSVPSEAPMELAVAIGLFGAIGVAVGSGDVAALVAIVLCGGVAVGTFKAGGSATDGVDPCAVDKAGRGGFTLAEEGTGCTAVGVVGAVCAATGTGAWVDGASARLWVGFACAAITRVAELGGVAVFEALVGPSVCGVGVACWTVVPCTILACAVGFLSNPDSCVFAVGGTVPDPGAPMPGKTVPCCKLPSFGCAAEPFEFEVDAVVEGPFA